MNVIREEIDLLLMNGITDEELERAKRGYLQAQRVERTRDRTLAGTLSNTIFAERTMSYYTELEEQMRNLTAKGVVSAVRRHFGPDRLVVVTAGDFEKSE